MQDAPQARHKDGEVLTWLRRMGNSSAINPELRKRFIPNGKLDVTALRRAAPGGEKDMAWLLFPSRERALDRARAYRLIVMEQSFDRGRSATIAPDGQFTEVKKDQSTKLREAGAVYRDGRLQLDWGPRHRK